MTGRSLARRFAATFMIFGVLVSMAKCLKKRNHGRRISACSGSAATRSRSLRPS